MSNPKQHIKEQRLNFYITPEHACSYLPGKDARTLFADPGFPMNINIYTALARVGFRRSGRHIYKPRCQHCNACIAIRLPVNKFIMNRNQKRNWRLNKDLKIIKFPAGFNNEHYKLYKRYLEARHPDGGMDNPDAENYIDFGRYGMFVPILLLGMLWGFVYYYFVTQPRMLLFAYGIATTILIHTYQFEMAGIKLLGTVLSKFILLAVIFHVFMPKIMRWFEYSISTNEATK
ncbi:MAG: hypothetical protein IH836_04615 [Proteobacteria bacterium]|nr:hypothetical protein [Pseudomonadota bacterium]